MNAKRRSLHTSPSRRRTQYRRGLRRREWLFTTLIVVGVTLCLLAIAVLIIGGQLHKKSAALRETDTVELTEPVVPPTPVTPTVTAYPIDRAAPFSSLATIEASGASAGSLALNKKDGTLLYSADTLASLASQAKTDGTYLSGVFYLTSLSEPDDLDRLVLRSEECALVAEALRAGLDDVLLVAPTLSAEHLPELESFVAELRRYAPNAVVGLALPRSVFPSENAATVIDSLAKTFSFLASDATQVGTTDAVAYVGQVAEADLYYLLRYSMRLLLPSETNGERQAALLSAAREYGINNLQILP